MASGFDIHVLFFFLKEKNFCNRKFNRKTAIRKFEFSNILVLKDFSPDASN